MLTATHRDVSQPLTWTDRISCLSLFHGEEILLLSEGVQDPERFLTNVPARSMPPEQLTRHLGRPPASPRCLLSSLLQGSHENTRAGIKMGCGGGGAEERKTRGIDINDLLATRGPEVRESEGPLDSN